MAQHLIFITPLLVGYVLDLIFGDPYKLPHPVRFFGTLITIMEKILNRDTYRFLKGLLMVLVLCVAIFVIFAAVQHFLRDYHILLYLIFSSVFVFYGLANKSLITEGEKVFDALEYKGVEAARKQLSWIVGRDTSSLNARQIRTAVFETMSENLSDGVIAPLFYYLIAGIPGMMTYKMINTLDSMIGYRNDRYELFGKFAARADDVVNFVPSRLTALLMIMVTWNYRGLQFILRYGRHHKSPNSGYPEAALAGIMDLQFGGPNLYHGIIVDKPFIGTNNREIGHGEFREVSSINQGSCLLMVFIMIILFL